MNVDRAEELLARYYEGQTDEAEERELKRFFLETEVPAHLQREKEIFLALEAEAGVPQDLEERLNRSIDAWEAEEKLAAQSVRRTRIIRLRWAMGVAASLVILFSLGIWHMQPRLPQDTCATPEEAYEHTCHALLTLSSTLNRGVEEMEKVGNTNKEIHNTLQESLNLMKYKQQ